MRKLLLVLIYFTIQLIQAQTYYPIPTDSSYKWYGVEYYKSGGNGGGGDYHYFKKDTIINGKQYFLDSREHTLFREENKKCYIWDTLFLSSEILLYDFNLLKGDTFIVSGEYQFLTNNRDTLVVDSIGITMVAGTPRKTWFFESIAGPFTPYRFECEDPLTPSYSQGYNWWNFKWIEGVGSNMSFYWILYTFNLCNETEGFCETCISHNDTLYYETDNQFIHDSLTWALPCGKTVSLNKSNSKFNLFYSSENQQIESDILGKIEVFNLSGQLLISETSKTLDVSNLPNSLYICKITASNNFQTLKFLKQ